MPRTRIVFLDTDFFVLMAGANLVAQVLDAVECDLQHARRLEALPHMLRRGPLTRQYSRGVCDKAAAWCERIGGIETRPSVKLEKQLLELVDPGEAQLFATVAELENGLVATGDKRACEAVATAAGLSDVRSRLTGKVLCLESALDLLLERAGFETLANALISVRDFNQTLRLLLPESSATPEDHFRAGLASFLRDMEQRAGILLFSSG